MNVLEKVGQEYPKCLECYSLDSHKQVSKLDTWKCANLNKGCLETGTLLLE